MEGDPPTNGMVNQPNRTIGSVATYSCNPDFLIVGGDQMRTCLDNATWDGEELVCSGKYFRNAGEILKAIRSVFFFSLSFSLHSVHMN